MFLTIYRIVANVFSCVLRRIIGNLIVFSFFFFAILIPVCFIRVTLYAYIRQQSCMVVAKVNELGYGYHLNDIYTTALAYAYDITITCPSRRGLHKMLLICNNFGKKLDSF